MFFSCATIFTRRGSCGKVEISKISHTIWPTRLNACADFRRNTHRERFGLFLRDGDGFPFWKTGRGCRRRLQFFQENEPKERDRILPLPLGRFLCRTCETGHWLTKLRVRALRAASSLVGIDSRLSERCSLKE